MVRSIDYWEQRYAKGGNSGSGSRGELANYKAEVINDFVLSNIVQSVLELGCGDGYQLDLYRMPEYIGQDVSSTIINKLRNKYDHLSHYAFAEYPYPCEAELGLSIDVLFHVIDYDEYLEYLDNLFDWSTEYVIIYAFDSDRTGFASHYVPRKFTKVIKERFPEWELDKVIKNKYPVEKYGAGKGSYSDFYFYRKMI